MRKFFGPKGCVTRITVKSHALEKNLLGDPTERVVDLYIPQDMTDEACRCLWILSASRGVACPIPIGQPSRRTCRSGWTG